MNHARTPYCWLALIVLAIFYGIYFAKSRAQKKRGIQTRQIGKRKERVLHTVETLMSIATYGVVIAQLLSIALEWNTIPSGARYAGFAIGLIGDVIFLISVLFMRDSWRAGIPERDQTTLVTDGIYRFSRNPAFLGFDLQYIGLFLIYGNWLTAIFSAFSIVMLHLQILQEEKYLTGVFGAPYEAYRKRVNRYLGRRRA